MEELLKSLNISEVISKNNRTLLVPIDSAWSAVNGSTLPFGRLIRDLKFMTIQGVYTSDQFNTTRNYTTGRHSTISISSSLVVNNVSKIVETDILTTLGVIHLIDTVVEPPPKQKQSDPSSSSSMDNTTMSEQQQAVTSNASKLLSSAPFWWLLYIGLFFLK